MISPKQDLVEISTTLFIPLRDAMAVGRSAVHFLPFRAILFLNEPKRGFEHDCAGDTGLNSATTE
jgi:hypothetical protein